MNDPQDLFMSCPAAWINSAAAYGDTPGKRGLEIISVSGCVACATLFISDLHVTHGISTTNTCWSFATREYLFIYTVLLFLRRSRFGLFTDGFEVLCRSANSHIKALFLHV